jgi:phosphate transport system substrate-binding protein
MTSMLKFKRKLIKYLVSACFLCTLSVSGQEAVKVKVDKDLPGYQEVSGVSGNLSSIGSDSMNNLMTFWLEEFKKIYPNINIQIEGKGSSTAPPALISGTSQLGAMSRQMKSEEVDKFEAKFGYKPTEIKVAIDALAIYVNKDNPIERLTLKKIDAIFSKTRKGGYRSNINSWDDLGLQGEWKNRRISLYGRNSASGTYGFFKENALFKGDFKNSVNEQPGSASVVQAVTKDKFGIGYSGIGYNTSGVKTVALSFNDNSGYSEPNFQNVLNGTYPMARYLFIYINNSPNKPMDPLLKEFLKFVLSYQGQRVVIKDGFIPLPNEIAEKELSKLQ